MAYVTVKDFNNTLKNISDKTLYTNSNVELDVNNLEKIVNCDKFSFNDLMNVLSYKNAEVVLTSDLGTLIHEKGSVVSGGTTLTANVTKGSVKITSVEFFKDGTSVSQITSDVENGGNFTYAYGLDISVDTEFKVIVTCEDGATIEEKLNIEFVNPYYYGITNKSLSDIIDTDILGLTKDVSKKGEKGYSFTSNNNKVLVAYDKNYGLLSSILDPNKFENINSYEYKELDINGVMYYVYETKTSFYCTNFKYIFK